jgi:Recombination endonuclease VII
LLRTCTKCGIEKPESAFYSVTQRGITRLRRICKECFRAQLHDHSEDGKPEGRVCSQCGVYKPLSQFHKHKICLYGVEPMCKECRLRKRRVYNRRYPERIRNTDLKAKYGMTIEDYNAMHTRQNGRCAICGTSEEKLVVDHDHKTGQVRELLCHLCNAMIGCAREDIAILTSAVAYLQREQHSEREDVRATISAS